MNYYSGRYYTSTPEKRLLESIYLKFSHLQAENLMHFVILMSQREEIRSKIFVLRLAANFCNDLAIKKDQNHH
jgi:hypothetical protein